MADFIIKALAKEEFEELFTLSDLELIEKGAIRMRVDSKPGFPCRISLQDANIGDEVILLTYEHHKTASPYKASGPIFIRKHAETARLKANQIPEMLIHRQVSVRCYNVNGMMKTAKVIEGKELTTFLSETFEEKEISYVHIHNAKPGCYNCVAERAYRTGQ
jgi:hypothetical protein